MTAGRTDLETARTKIFAYLPLLEDIPEWAFNTDTLKEAAMCKWFPSYAEVRAVLEAHVREERRVEDLTARVKRLPAPEISPEERARNSARLKEIVQRLSLRA